MLVIDYLPHQSPQLLLSQIRVDETLDHGPVLGREGLDLPQPRDELALEFGVGGGGVDSSVHEVVDGGLQDAREAFDGLG